ncbi:carbohydrate ABC transporter permease [Paenibacillus agricola]|uniref:Carbohydrate ABC transporter permease n=1 Tax=Paenibacillus agricola TaxID=2716264 RepID=A0ABX0JFW9_9BACL|nr:carbohydrate ABC transporter permease [Paenibacillus agricola]NHN34111.1 carbohydrate ABC transporter permease [Paenibacillus agricola]
MSYKPMSVTDKAVSLRNKPMSLKKQRLILLEIMLIVFTIIYFLPFYIVITMAMKTPSELLLSNFGLPKTLNFDNFVKAWEITKYSTVLFNTAFISLLSVAGIILVASMAAFTLAKQANKLNTFLYYFFLSGIMIPSYTVLVPLVKLLKSLYLMNSKLGLVIVYIGHGLPFAVFLLVGFIRSIPKEIMEAGTIDGCNVYQLYWRILLPMLQSVIITLFILDLIWIWNDFLLPLLVLQKKTDFTLTLSQYSMHGEFGTQWQIVFAGFLLAIAPLTVVYLALQKYVISGISAGALKG